MLTESQYRGWFIYTLMLSKKNVSELGYKSKNWKPYIGIYNAEARLTPYDGISIGMLTTASCVSSHSVEWAGLKCSLGLLYEILPRSSLVTRPYAEH